jgi:hypothetical protein
MWFDAPGIFYANRIRLGASEGQDGTMRRLGVTDVYLLDLLRETTQNLRSWCLNERRNIFHEAS